MIVEAQNKLQKDKTETHAELPLTVSCNFGTLIISNKAKHNSDILGRTTAKPVGRRCRNKRKYTSALAHSRNWHPLFLENNLAGKPDLASPEDKSIAVIHGYPDYDKCF